MTEVHLFLKRLGVEVVVAVEVEVAEAAVVVEGEVLEVVLAQWPWEGCSVEECLNYDQSATAL